MDPPLCQSCTERPTEIIVLPGQNPDVLTEYLCSSCFTSIMAQHYQALPYAFTKSGNNGQPEGMEQEFGSKADELVIQLHTYQDLLKTEVSRVKAEYENLFANLLENLKSVQAKVLSAISDSEAIEIEHVNAMIQDLKATRGILSLSPESSYLAPYFSSIDIQNQPPFVRIPEGLDQFSKMMEDFPEPKFNPITYENPSELDSIQKRRTIRQNRRLIEDDFVLMPIDSLNMLLIDLSNVIPERKMIPCPSFPYRVEARWCKVDDTLYLYSGGLYKSVPIPWCDFIDIRNFITDGSGIESQRGKDMKLARHRHAMICHEHVVYAFGGGWAEAGVDIQAQGVEMLQQYGDWQASEWQSLCKMPELFDPTVTILKNVIYLAGKGKSIFKFNTENHELSPVSISRIYDLDIARAQAPDNAAPVLIRHSPLPRQSSNSLIYSWESQIVVLQHDYMFSFEPGENVEMFKKRMPSVKPWCSQFPVVIKGSKGYFMLEATETDLTPAGDVWSFDFIKKSVALVQFDKTKDR